MTKEKSFDFSSFFSIKLSEEKYKLNDKKLKEKENKIKTFDKNISEIQLKEE